MRAGVPVARTEDFLSRLLGKVERVTESGCWVWMGLQTARGYGQTSFRHKKALVHRAMYEALVGPIPKGELACHRCDVRTCCNPAHIFIGTNKDNVRDCIAKGRGKAFTITHCKHGHEFNTENTRFIHYPDGRRTRVCAACRKAYGAAYQARKHAAKAKGEA